MKTSRFEPSVLKWARETRFGPKIERLTDERVESWKEISSTLVIEWESGGSEPSFSQVKRLAEIYKRPLAVFFLESPPEEKRNPPDLRTIRSHDNKNLSPEALLIVRKTRRIQQVAAELYEDLGEKLSFKYRRFSLDENASDLGERIRTDLAISTKDQFGAGTFENFFENVRSKIEDTGVLTLKSGGHDSFPIADCRAFSFADELPYVILVNNKDYEGAKIFSLAHEFAHLLLRQPGICNNYKSFAQSKTASAIEVFCNQFAASFLVPREPFLAHRLINGKSTIPQDEIDSAAENLALDFKVSRVVIARRLLSLGLISPSLYKAKTKAWEQKLPPTRKGTGRFSLSTMVKKNGKTFSRLVIEALQKNKISYAGASDYLGVKTKHLRGLEKLINLHAAE